MKIIKIFLASSEELRDERKELADLVEHLNFTLNKQDLCIQLVKWEYLDSSMGPLHKQEEYNKELRDCELCMVLFWTRFGMYTKTELDTAYRELCAGNNPKKLYVYFKDGEEISSELKEFRDAFPEKYGHFFCHFQNVDTLKADFLLQFMEYLNLYLKDKNVIEIKDSQVSINGKVYVNLQNVPFAGNNEEYNLLLNSIKKTKKLLSVTEENEPEYAEYVAELKELEEKQAQMESSLWDTALMVTKLSTTKCSERLQRAMELFGRGDNKGAQAILNEEEIEKDIQHNLHLIELGKEGKRGLKTNIDEYLLKIKTLENDKPEGWSTKVQELYLRCVKLGEENLDGFEYAKLLSEYGDFLHWQRKYDLVEETYLESNKFLKEVLQGGGDDSVNYFLRWNLRALSEYYINSNEFKKAEEILTEALSYVSEDCLSERAEILDYLAYIHYEQLDFEAAEKEYVEVLRLLEGDCDEEVQEIKKDTHYYLSLLYRQDHEYEKAEMEIKAALKIHNALYKEETPEVYRLYESLGNIYESQCKISEAEDVFIRARKIIDKLAEENPDTHKIDQVCALSNLSRVHKFANKIDLAIVEMEAAVDIAKELFIKYPKQHAHYYSHCITDLSFYYKICRRYDDAISLLKQSISVYDSLLQTDAQKHLVNKGVALNFLSVAYIEDKQYEKARETLLEALSVFKGVVQNYGRKYLGNLAQIYTNLGDLELETRHFKEAEGYCQEAIDIYLSDTFEVKPEENGDLAIVELNMGIINRQVKNNEEAEIWLQRALLRFRNLTIVRDDAGRKALMIKVLIQLSSIALSKKENGKAINYAHEAYEIADALYMVSKSSNELSYCQAANQYAWCLFKGRDNERAEEIALKAVDTARHLNIDSQVRRCLDTLGCIHREQGKFDEAEHELFEALALSKKIWEEGHDDRVQAQIAHGHKELSVLFYRQGNAEKCQQNSSIAKSIFESLEEDIIESYQQDIADLKALN